MLTGPRLRSLNFCGETIEDELNFLLSCGSHENVVDIYSDDDEHTMLIVNEYRFICIGLFEAEFEERLFKIVGPEERRLLETVESFVEKTYPVGGIASGELWRLFNINFVIDVGIEKSRFDVELINEKKVDDSDRENEANRRSFDNRGEGIRVVESGNLSKALSN